MRNVYRVLAFLVAAEVAIQASFVVWADAGFGKWIEEGGVADKGTVEAAIDSGDFAFPEMAGLMLHGMNGMMVIPGLALLLVISSFFAKVPRGVAFGFAVLGLVVLQVTLGLVGHAIPFVGALHGINALVLFSVAAWTGLRVARASADRDASAHSVERVAV